VERLIWDTTGLETPCSLINGPGTPTLLEEQRQSRAARVAAVNGPLNGTMSPLGQQSPLICPGYPCYYGTCPAVGGKT